ncbi:glutamate receptor ionotropic, kainate 2-like isoform X8 [Bombus vosnesenskii]|uniref:Glutamate receptor ionotropic, kainate 2-like isoform X8 n=2 Tax=Pyrobombus TaxID=144703 RepID=A0A6J3K983_9HYME|nr:glutamate receptor ionotropic, kainate 2-like isoform X8 [Bombus vancouverensis nearcticus]XP_033297399.1 glutamate receptor ionotropic, kainate 2 isoform X7 [Bombus bifarius]XP_033348599.1 glutamate receptor ionotropic, kainate 2-like isoform X8 [Bombus vosnesenskii]
MNLGCLVATVFVLQLLFNVTALPSVVKIGAIFTHDQKDSSTELAFKYAVYKINKERLILPKTTLEYDIQYVPKDDSFHASKKACQQVKYGVQAVFGPSDPILGQHIHSICDALDIPHLEARLDLDTEAKEFSINLYPAQSLLNAAYQDIMEFLNWTKVAIIYEDDYGLVKLRELVRSPKSREIEVNLRQADPDSYRQVLSEMKSKEIRNLIVDTRPEHMHHFLRMILQLQMNDYKYHYLFTTFDIETFDLEDFKYNFVNITAFRLVDAEDVGVRGILRDMERYQPSGNTILNKSRVIQAEPALMYDSVQVFAVGLRTLEQSHALRPANISCEMEHPWDGGLSLINYINSVEMKGISGPIEFKEGRRIQFKLDLLKLKQHSLVKVGEWRPGAGVNVTDTAAFFEPGTANVTLLVITILKADLAVGSMTINYARESVIDFTKPFMNLGISILFKVPTSHPARLFSFMNPLAIQIWLYVLAAYVLVSVMMFVVARISPYEWNNPHPCHTESELVENQFSLANSFWFTIGTLMQQGSDLNPKATSTRIVGGIWWFFTLIIISSYTANLAAFLTVERMITPIENAEDLAGQTDIAYGTLDSGSTMTFFRDSMIETYKKMWRFMENKKPSVFVPTYEEGIQRVLQGDYAFLMESTMLDYIVQRDCNLTQIGGLLDSKGYGIATPMGSPWRDKISLAILELQEKGEIQMLYDKWWKSPGDTCMRTEKGKESKANSLGVDNIGGVFVVLLCGLAFAVLIAIFEFCYSTRRNMPAERRAPVSTPICTDSLQGISQSVQQQQQQQTQQQQQQQPQQQPNQHQESLCSEMARELCRALRCHASSRRRRACEKCSTHVLGYTPDNPTATPLNGMRSQRSSLGVPTVELPPHVHLHHHAPPPHDYDGT